jgi:hypothetical protein
VQQRQKQILHARVSVGQTSAARNVAESAIPRENYEFETHSYVPVPNILLENYSKLSPPITGQELVFLLQVMVYKWDRRPPFPSYAAIAGRMRLSDSRVRKIAQSLEQKGYLRREFMMDDNNRFHLDGLFDALHAAVARRPRPAEPVRQVDDAA